MRPFRNLSLFRDNFLKRTPWVTVQTRRQLAISTSVNGKSVQDGATNTQKVCIVGAGPAGFYAAQYLVKHLPDAEVDIVEKLPVPFGLVR